jgi:hypothetical protein
LQDSATPSAAASHQAPAAGGESYDYGSGAYVYNDFSNRRHPRGDAAEQAATRLCDHGVSDGIGLAPFNACMRAHGWRFAKFIAAPAPDVSVTSDPDPTPVDNTANDNTQQMINQQMALDAATAAAAEQNNAAMAAAQQTMNNANFIQQ